MISSCNKFYFVQAGDTCGDIATHNGIALTDFYAWYVTPLIRGYEFWLKCAS